MVSLGAQWKSGAHAHFWQMSPPAFMTALQSHPPLKSRCLLIRGPSFTLLPLHLFTPGWSQVFNMYFLVHALVRELFQNQSKFWTQTIPKTGNITMQWHSLEGEQFVLCFSGHSRQLLMETDMWYGSPLTSGCVPSFRLPFLELHSGLSQALVAVLWGRPSRERSLAGIRVGMLWYIQNRRFRLNTFRHETFSKSESQSIFFPKLKGNFEWFLRQAPFLNKVIVTRSQPQWFLKLRNE